MVTSVHRTIQPPPRSTLYGTALAVVSGILLSILSVARTASPLTAALACIPAAVSLFKKEIPVFHLALFTVLLAISSLFRPVFHVWPWGLLVPLAVYFGLVFSIHPLRKSVTWIHPGNFGKNMALLCIAIALVSGLALFLWYRLVQSDLSVHLARIPSMPDWLFPLAGVGFAIGNAALEEVIFRGLVMQATDSAFGPGRISILAQAWLFAILHFLRGFPNGFWGLAMTFIYGMMLGVIRRRSQGLLAPWLTHVFADLVIFIILAGIVFKEI